MCKTCMWQKKNVAQDWAEDYCVKPSSAATNAGQHTFD